VEAGSAGERQEEQAVRRRTGQVPIGTDAHAALYIRVSSEEQTKGYSLDGQRRAGRELLAREAQDRKVVEYCDVMNGSNEARPAFTRLQADILAGRVASVTALCSDRLARRHETFLRLEREWIARGIVLSWSNGRRYDPSPQGRFAAHIESAATEYEKELIAGRTIRGRKDKALRGEVPTAKAPYGYRYVRRADSPTGKACFVIEPEKAAVIRRNFELFVGKGYSLRALAGRLQTDGIESPGRLFKGGIRRPVAWTTSTLRKMLRNETYCGTLWWNRYERINEDRKNVPLAKDDWIGVPVPAIVPRALWQRAQEQLDRNLAQFNGRPNRHATLLLRGVGRCACGKSLATQAKRRGFQYRCITAQSAAPCAGRKTWMAGPIDERLKGLLLEFVSDPEDACRHLMEANGPARRAAMKDSARLTARLAELEKADDQYVRLYARKGFSPERLDVLRAELVAERERLTAELATARAALGLLDLARIKTLAARMPDLQRMSAEQWALVVRQLVREVVLSRDAALVRLWIGPGAPPARRPGVPAGYKYRRPVGTGEETVSLHSWKDTLSTPPAPADDDSANVLPLTFPLSPAP
jgi:site-specific DNA recombinase